MGKILTVFDDSKKAMLLIGAALLILIAVAFGAEGEDKPQYVLAQAQMPITRSIDSWESNQYWYDPASLEPASGGQIPANAISVKKFD